MELETILNIVIHHIIRKPNLKEERKTQSIERYSFKIQYNTTPTTHVQYNAIENNTTTYHTNMAIRILLTVTCLVAPFVTGFGPAALVQRNTMTNTITSPRSTSISNVRLEAVSNKNTESTGIVTKKFIYNPDSKEVPKVLGGVKIGLRKLVVITGASSGLGLSTTVALAKTGKYHIVMACRDIKKAKRGE